MANAYSSGKNADQSLFIYVPMRIYLHPAAMLVLAITASVGLSDGAFVLDQIGSVYDYDPGAGPGSTPSQVFTDFPDFSCMVLEDFTVTADELQITSVSALFRAQGGFAGFQQVDGYSLSIFSDPALAATGLSGDVANLLVVAGSGVLELVDDSTQFEYGLVSLDVSIFLPAAGQYWFGVSPVSASSVSGQFFLQNSGASGGIPGNQDARFANPGDGFGLGSFSTSDLDYAYSVTAVPEPVTATLALLSGCGWLFRRGRSAPI